ncbi:MAG: molybdopterin-dependent oxidoreductase [Anaerolineae bacterium]|nr:molybdopterin-dependent oxidoreductase [Thermoflexales bacterium]MDW8406472.1 molybdopterin-dependent oxidoreductase [Anaerolineae bacterium]
MVNLKIDGQEISAPEGTTVLRAAEAAGIAIPKLCDHKELTPYGGCRLCLVEVEGARTLQPSCTLPVSDKMVVWTNTPQVREARRFVLSLIFSERNHFCMYCPVSGGDCELQNAAYAEGMTHWPLQPNWQPYPVDASHKDFVLDNNRCILCRRCIRACGELVGNFTLGVEERGARTMVIADLGVPLGESTCIACGTCIQVCPTGALIDRAGAYRGREKDSQKTASICAGCSIGCGVVLITRDNNLLRIEGDWDAPVNQGLLCELGRFRPLDDPGQRILTPLVRKDGALKAATWEEAIGVTAAKLQPLAGKNGSGMAAIASPRLTAETLCAFSELFATKLGSAQLATTDDPAPAPVPSTGTLADLHQADCVVVAGADLVANHQVAGFFIKRAVPKGTRLIVIDAGESQMKALADCAITPNKGGEPSAIAGIVAALKNQAVDVLAAHSGAPADALAKAASMLAAAKTPVIVAGPHKHLAGALSELADTVAAKIVSVYGKANTRAALAYKIDGAFDPKGKQAVFVALGDEKPTQKLIQQVEHVPFVVVQAAYTSQLTAVADVVFPVETWAEQEGHFVNVEGAVQRVQRGLIPPDEVWSSARVLHVLAQKMGYELTADWQRSL